ncbi:MAG: methylated-DNA--[protein]-cysteine S-methyltransferase [Thermodesulfobacteriota bacterium]
MHLSFSAAAHAKALDFLAHAATPVQPLPRQDPLALWVQKALAAYARGHSPLQLPFSPASPFLLAATPFQRRVWAEIRRIPYGQSRTYGKLAARLGQPAAARAVGQACHANPLALIIPCHRVVAAQGPGGFAGDIGIKHRLLALEQGQRLPEGCRS